MADIQRQYYYKNVEAAYKRFNEVCASMLPLAEDMGMTQAEDLKMWTQFQGFNWSKHPSVVHLGLTESELTDDQKEEIALSNKVEFDAAIKELNEMSDLWESVTKKSDIVEQATTDMTDMVLDSIKNSLMYDYHGELNGEYDAPPITLTADELYWALDLIGAENGRLVLSEQSPQVFDALYNAYQKGKESFSYTYRNINSVPMKGLRITLMNSIKDTESFLLYLRTQLLENKSLLAMLSGEILDDEDQNLSEVANYLLCDEPLDNFDTQCLLDSYEHKVGKALKISEDIEGFNQFEKKKLQRLKGSLSTDLPGLQINQEESIRISPKMLNIVTTLTDKWLVQKLHERAKENIQPKSPVEVKKVEVKKEKSKKYSVSFERLPVPTRFTDNRIGSQHYEAILRQLYSLYGYNFIDMSEDDFVYFFEGTNKKPSTYKPPYYWNGSAPAMKALLRILYTSTTGETDSSRSFGRLILMPKDRDMGTSYHDWRGKHNLGVGRLTAIENSLQDIVRNVTGKNLSPIDLNRKYDYGDEEGDKATRKSKKKKDNKDEKAES